MEQLMKLRQSLAILLTLALMLPFVQLPVARAAFAPLYDTLNYENPPVAPAERSLPSGSYVATPFRINNAYGEIDAVMLYAKYDNTVRPTITKAKMSVAIYSDNNGRPGSMLSGASGSYELDDQIDIGGPSNPFSLFYIELDQPGKLYRDNQYWVVYGTTDTDAARVSLVGVNEQPLAEGQGTNNLVTDTHQPARVTESTRVMYSLQNAGTDIAVTDWSSAQRTEGQILPFILDGWVSERHENLEVQYVTDTTAHVSFGPSNNATEVTLEQSMDNGATWVTVKNVTLNQNSNDVTVTGLSPSTTYLFRLVVEDGYKGGISNTAQATTQADPGWRLVGDAGFSGEMVRDTELAIDGRGVPYIAYVDQAVTGKIVVQTFTGAVWESVGVTASEEEAGSVSLALDRQGLPYIAYIANDGSMTVRKYNGTAWVALGQPGFPGGETSLVDLKLDAMDRPYVAFRDIGGALGGAITVMKFDGSWEVVGSREFTPEASVRSLSLALASDGTPYVGYTAVPDGFYGSYKPFVYRLGDNGWTNISYASFGDPHSAVAQIALTASPIDDAIYVAYDDTYTNNQDMNANRQPSVIRWDGSGWDRLGAAGIAPRAASLRMVVDRQGVPYLAYAKRQEGTGPVSVLRWSGSAWEAVGGADFSGGSAHDMSFAIDPDGRPYVAYGDQREGEKSTVKVYPKPISNLSAARAGDKVQLSFDRPSGASQVVVLVSADGGMTWTTATTEQPLGYDSATATVTGLSASVAYQFKLQVTHGSRAGDSNISSVAAPPASSAPTYVAPPAKSVSLRVVDDQGKELSEPLTRLVGSQLALTGQLLSADGKRLSYAPITIKSGQPIELPSLAAGTYKLALNVVAPSGDKLAGTIAQLTVDAAGNATISSELIDPYGIVTDAVTGETVDDVHMTLHWSDTELNRSKGRTPGALVELPILPDFEPNQNRDPQSSTDGGKYGWMVYPEGDYYLLGEKEGYVTFDSRLDPRSEQHGEDSYIKEGNIHVGQSIVEYSFEIMPKTIDSGIHEAYMKGYPDGSFKAGRGVSRAELATVLTRTMEQRQTDDKGIAFKDVSAGHWAADSIRTASAQGWMKGYAGSVFKPEGQVTRAELAQALVNLYGWKTPESGTAASSDTATHWASKAIAAIQAQGVMEGYEDGAFRPDQAVTRAEAVKVFNQLLKRTPGQTVGVPSVWNDVSDTSWAYADIMEASVTHSYVLYATGVEQWTE